MIENGKRVPSQRLLEIIAEIFQKDVKWFFDETLEDESVEAVPGAGGRTGGIEGIPLEPGFLFSNVLLQTAIPELLSQAGITGRQFAHLLIRAHQEAQQNRFPDLERAAERIGCAPAEVLFVDDSARNVAGAQAAGWRAVQFTDAAALATELGLAP